MTQSDDHYDDARKIFSCNLRKVRFNRSLIFMVEDEKIDLLFRSKLYFHEILKEETFV